MRSLRLKVVINKYFLFIILALICLESKAQDNGLTVGLQFKPIIPSDITNSGSFTFTEDFVNISVNPKFGYSYGAIVRQSFSKKLSLETGISYVRRNFDFQLIDLDSSFTTGSSVGLVNYEVPICGLFYVQLGEQFYMNNSLGVSLDFFASDVGSDGVEFRQETFYRKWIQPALKANVGFEYRTKKDGYLYFGVTFHNPFDNIALTIFNYRKQQVIYDFTSDINGGYLTADFRYFFNPKK